jgi:N-acetylglucosamine-6-sulfatase
LLADHGVTFSNAFVTPPVCCPARSRILTGQYSRHTGVLDNKAPNGGALAFDDRSSLATWLSSGGYETALVGK